MVTGDRVGVEPETVHCDASLELDGKQTILTGSDDTGADRWPRRERAWIVEWAAGLITHSASGFGRQVGWYVVAVDDVRVVHISKIEAQLLEPALLAAGWPVVPTNRALVRRVGIMAADMMIPRPAPCRR